MFVVISAYPAEGSWALAQDKLEAVCDDLDTTIRIMDQVQEHYRAESASWEMPYAAEIEVRFEEWQLNTWPEGKIDAR